MRVSTHRYRDSRYQKAAKNSKAMMGMKSMELSGFKESNSSTQMVVNKPSSFNDKGLRSILIIY
jgi:hypothetical protein